MPSASACWIALFIRLATSLTALKRMPAHELLDLAEECGIQEGVARQRKQDVIFNLLKVLCRLVALQLAAQAQQSFLVLVDKIFDREVFHGTIQLVKAAALACVRSLEVEIHVGADRCRFRLDRLFDTVDDGGQTADP